MFDLVDHPDTRPERPPGPRPKGDPTLSRTIVIAAILLTTLALPAEATVRSFQGSLAQDDIVSIAAENTGIKVLNYRFVRPLRSEGGLFKGNEPTMDLTITNEGDEPRGFSVAVALFDLEGKLVGVASDTPGKLKPGVTEELSLSFRHLNRFAKYAKTFTLSIEIEPTK